MIGEKWGGSGRAALRRTPRNWGALAGACASKGPRPCILSPHDEKHDEPHDETLPGARRGRPGKRPHLRGGRALPGSPAGLEGHEATVDGEAQAARPGDAQRGGGGGAEEARQGARAGMGRVSRSWCYGRRGRAGARGGRASRRWGPAPAEIRTRRSGRVLAYGLRLPREPNGRDSPPPRRRGRCLLGVDSAHERTRHARALGHSGHAGDGGAAGVGRAWGGIRGLRVATRPSPTSTPPCSSTRSSPTSQGPVWPGSSGSSSGTRSRCRGVTTCGCTGSRLW